MFKRTVICAVVLAGASSMSGCEGSGERIEQRNDRTGSQVERRTDQEIDRTVDRALDNVFDG